MIYGCYDMSDPFVEVWFSDTLVCTIKTTTVDGKVITKPTMVDPSNVDDEQIKEMIPIISGGIMNSLTQMNLSRMAGYKKGQKAMEEAAAGLENDDDEDAEEEE